MKGNFDKIIQSEKPVLVDFYATWCGPCKAQGPILKELSDEVGEYVRIIKIDVDKNQVIAERFNIKGVPTLILFKNGKILYRKSGVSSKSELLELIKKNN